MANENRGPHHPDWGQSRYDRVYQAERSPLSALEEKILTDIEIQLELQDPRLATRFRWDPDRGRWQYRPRWWHFGR